jgi:hypothetical protein
MGRNEKMSKENYKKVMAGVEEQDPKNPDGRGPVRQLAPTIGLPKPLAKPSTSIYENIIHDPIHDIAKKYATLKVLGDLKNLKIREID